MYKISKGDAIIWQSVVFAKLEKSSEKQVFMDSSLEFGLGMVEGEPEHWTFCPDLEPTAKFTNFY